MKAKIPFGGLPDDYQPCVKYETVMALMFQSWVVRMPGNSFHILS